MNNQQLKAHCEDVIANPQDHQDWVVDMARVALASLEAKKLTTVYQGTRGKQSVIGSEVLPLGATDVYTAPPVAVMQPVVLPVMQVDNPLDGFFYRCDEVIAAIRAAGGSVKE